MRSGFFLLIPVQSLSFHGTVESGEAGSSWTSERLEDPWRTDHVAVVRVELDPSLSSEPGVMGSPPTGTLDLDVCFEDNDALFDRGLFVRWTTALDDGTERQGGERQGGTEQGILSCEANNARVERVLLGRGAPVTFVRPEGWRGEWTIDTAWRRSPDDPWREFKSFHSSAPRISRTSFRACEWLFRMSSASEDQEDVPRTLRLFPGEDRA